MKKRIIVCFLAILIFDSCSAPTIPNIYKTDIIPSNIILMPYKDNTERYGYVNSETFEIVIPAQYEYAGAFVNGFAVVSKKWDISKEKDKRNNFLIINQKNEIVIENIDYAKYLIESEDRKTLYALTLNFMEFERVKIEVGPFFVRHTIVVDQPKGFIYRLYNLNTGKLVLERTAAFDVNFRRNKPDIVFFDNYMTYDKDIYEIKDDGVFEKKDMKEKEIEELIAKTVKERKLEDVILYRYYGKMYMYIETFDFDLLIKNLPKRFRLYNWDIWKKGDDWIDDVKESYKHYRGSKVVPFAVNRDEFHPLVEKVWLFHIDLYPKEGNPKYVGLYNASENRWAIPPIEEDFSSEFKLTGYDDLICYAEAYSYYSDPYPYFYNIKTKEKSKFLYGYNSEKRIFAYMGYYESENKVIIEKF